MLAADRHDALGRLIVGAEILRVTLTDGLLQFGSAAGRSVLREVVLDGCDACLLDVIGRREVGLAHS